MCESRSEMLSPTPLGQSLSPKSGGGDCVCESRRNALPYPFGSITESKIRWWGLCVNPEEMLSPTPLGQSLSPKSGGGDALEPRQEFFLETPTPDFGLSAEFG